MKSLIEKLDGMLQELDGLFFARSMDIAELKKMLNHLKQLVIAEQDRIVEALKEAEGYLDESEGTWHHGAILREDAIKLVKDE